MQSTMYITIRLLPKAYNLYLNDINFPCQVETFPYHELIDQLYKTASDFDLSKRFSGDLYQITLTYPTENVGISTSSKFCLKFPAKGFSYQPLNETLHRYLCLQYFFYSIHSTFSFRGICIFFTEIFLISRANVTGLSAVLFVVVFLLKLTLDFYYFGRF